MNQGKKVVLITGAGGFLGGMLLKKFFFNNKFMPIALTSDKDRILKKHPYMDKYLCLDIDDWNKGKIYWNEIDVVVHCAFSRASNPLKLSESLCYTEQLLNDATKNNSTAFINISSQGVYGKNDPLWTENTPPSPDYLYAMAKYTSELLTRNICKGKIPYTNIRLAGLTGGQIGVQKGAIYKFVKNALEGKVIKVTGENQVLSNIDVRDAAEGIMALINLSYNKWEPIYNLGCPWRHSILEIAQIVEKIAPKYIDVPVKIEVKSGDSYINAGIDASLFYSHTGWTPKYNMEDIIVSIFEYIKYNESNFDISYDIKK